MSSPDSFSWVSDTVRSGALVTLGSQDARRSHFINSLYAGYLTASSRPAALFMASPWAARRLVEALPENRLADIVTCDLTDRTLVVPANPLAAESGDLRRQVDILTRAARAVWAGRWQPDFEEGFRCALAALVAVNAARGKKQSQLGMALLPLLLRSTPTWIDNLTRKFLARPDLSWVAAYFQHRYKGMDSYERLRLVEPVVELALSLGQETALSLLSAPFPTLDPEDLFDRGKIILVIADAGRMGETECFFSHWMLSSAHAYLKERKSERPFLLAVDLLENFPGYEWEQLIDLASRPGVRMILSPANDDNLSLGFGERVCAAASCTAIFSPDSVRTPWIRSLFSDMMFNFLPDAVVVDQSASQAPYPLVIPPSLQESSSASYHRTLVNYGRQAYSAPAVEIQAEAIRLQTEFVAEFQKAPGSEKVRQVLGGLGRFFKG